MFIDSSLIKLQLGECLGKFFLVFAFVCTASRSCFSRSFWPFFLKKTIQYQGSLHLIFIMKINRLHKQATCKRKQSKRRFILVVSRSPYLTKSWFPWVLEMCFLCCLISLWAYLLKQQIVCNRKQSLCKKETHQPFLKININFVCEKISYDGSVSNHFRLLGDILVNKCWKLLTVG